MIEAARDYEPWRIIGKRAIAKLERDIFAMLARKPIAELTPDEWGFMRCVAPRMTTGAEKAK